MQMTAEKWQRTAAVLNAAGLAESSDSWADAYTPASTSNPAKNDAD